MKTGSEVQIMTLEIVQERKQQCAAKRRAKENDQKDQDWARDMEALNRLVPDLFGDKKTRGKRPAKKSLLIKRKFTGTSKDFKTLMIF